MSAPKVAVDGVLAEVRFDDSGLDAYRLFLRCKQLPERRVHFDPDTEMYRGTTQARFAALLDSDAAVAAPARRRRRPHTAGTNSATTHSRRSTPAASPSSGTADSAKP